MKAVRFLPPDFHPQEELTLAGVELSVLGIDDLKPDYAAVMESAAALTNLFHEGDNWPLGLTERANLIDLAWHEKEFARGGSYAWGLRRPAAATGYGQGPPRYLGSAYVYPDPDGVAVAHAVHWIRAGEDDPVLCANFKTAWEQWVRGWPMDSVRFSP